MAFLSIFEKKWPCSGNFFTLKCQFSGGSGLNKVTNDVDVNSTASCVLCVFMKCCLIVHTWCWPPKKCTYLFIPMWPSPISRLSVLGINWNKSWDFSTPVLLGGSMKLMWKTCIFVQFGGKIDLQSVYQFDFQ